MGSTPDDIRDEIATTRQQASEAADALAQRLDVGRRAQEATRELTETAQRQPMQALVAAAAVGFLAGRVTKRRAKR